jgi:hypothetical protein
MRKRGIGFVDDAFTTYLIEQSVNKRTRLPQTAGELNIQ